jgi:phosphate transport system permease protein
LRQRWLQFQQRQVSRCRVFVVPGVAMRGAGGGGEAAFALGAPRWKVSLAVTLRAVKGGVVTGVLLAVARMIGETAPLLFTALNNQFFSTDMSRPMANLPVVIYNFAMSPYEDWQKLAWGGAALIALIVLTINILARVLFRSKLPA